MTDTPVPASDMADTPVTAGDKAEDIRIPKARLDEEIGKRKKLEDDIAHMADAMLGGIPDKLKALIPDELSPAAKVAWFLKARDTGVFASGAPVPATDDRIPATSPKAADFNSLPANARIAAAYNKGR